MDSALVPELPRLQLSEVRVSSLEGELAVDAYFADGRGDRTHVLFLGVDKLKLDRFVPAALGYKLQLAPSRKVKLVPPRGRGISLLARAAMVVD